MGNEFQDFNNAQNLAVIAGNSKRIADALERITHIMEQHYQLAGLTRRELDARDKAIVKAG